jgi:hypothetical protein
MNKELEKEVQQFIMEYTQINGSAPSIDELNLYLSKLAEKMNTDAKTAFEGYSPEDMDHIIYDPWGAKSPLQFNTLQDSDFELIPILRQARHLISILLTDGKIKLTAAGYLPPKIVKELYALGIPDDFIEKGVILLKKEGDSYSVRLIRLMMKITKVTKEQKGVMTLTAIGKKIASNPQMLLQELMNSFSLKFNWAYYDRYNNMDLGRIGSAFSLILISKYGNEKHPCKFYANKYFEAFPMFAPDPEEKKLDTYHVENNCYTVRTFERFMLHFGLINIEENGQPFSINHKNTVMKTSLFDKMISITAPTDKRR